MSEAAAVVQKPVQAIGSFLMPKPEAPVAPPAPPGPDDAEAKKKMAAAEEEERRRSRGGRASTILTSGVGITEAPSVSRRVLLGN